MRTQTLIRPLLVLFVAAAADSAFAQGVPDPGLEAAHHAARRLTFGPTPALINQLRVNTNAIRQYIDDQLALNPATDPDFPFGHPELPKFVDPAFLPAPSLVPVNLGDEASGLLLSKAQLVYAILSRWQIREVITQLWDRHFNTNLSGMPGVFEPGIAAQNPGFTPEEVEATARAYTFFLEWEAQRFYRSNAFGTFRALLEYTSRHPTMGYYLNLQQNNVGSPNENFARELLELYTMGQERTLPNGAIEVNYTQDDVAEVARVFTGWKFIASGGTFVLSFNPNQHDTGNKLLFQSTNDPVTINGITGPDGVNEGMDLLQILSNRPATKQFICSKLMRFYLGDNAAATEPRLLLAMMSAWGTDGNVKEVLRTLLKSRQFLTTKYHWRRAKLPMEIVTSLPRAFAATVTNDLELTVPSLAMYTLGQALLQFPPPIGFPEKSEDQMSPSVVRDRVAYAANSMLPVGSAKDKTPVYDILGSLGLTAVTDTQAAAKLILDQMFGPDYKAEDQTAVADTIAVALNVLGPNHTPGTYEASLRVGVTTAASLTLNGIK